MDAERFTYGSYRILLKRVVDNGYEFTSYHDYMEKKNPCILRHDIDFSLKKASIMANLEAGLGQPVRSTWFVLLNTAFYNVCDCDQRQLLLDMMQLGHEIGLHYDETKYATGQNKALLAEAIQEEAFILGRLLGTTIRAFSFHRPSKWAINGNIQIPRLVNSYGHTFFREFKYLSDSRFCWREAVESIIEEKKYEKLHLLTHAFSYSEVFMEPKEKLRRFVCLAQEERYNALNNNIRNIGELLTWEEV